MNMPLVDSAENAIDKVYQQGKTVADYRTKFSARYPDQDRDIWIENEVYCS